jgi:hypothetical protein
VKGGGNNSSSASTVMDVRVAKAYGSRVSEWLHKNMLASHPNTRALNFTLL